MKLLLSTSVFKMGEVIILGKFYIILNVWAMTKFAAQTSGLNIYENRSMLNCRRRIFPDWKVHSKFITDHLNAALALDGKLSSHAIHVDCEDANRINQVLL